MRELFDFFIRNSKWFVYAFFVVASCMLLFQGNPYQHHVLLTSANSVTSAVYEVSNNVTSYFNLREINEDLNRRNASLEKEVINLREQLQRYAEAEFNDTLATGRDIDHFDFIVAHVINNSISRPFNYLTLDKGSADGVKPELGVIDQNGVIGIVSGVGPHSARVISLLNPNLRLSCKIKNSDHFGSLIWDGNDPTMALLEELPRHTVFTPGDTVVTSGYSAVFPSGLPVGVILDDGRNHNENFFTLKVRLFADFTALGNVQIVMNNYSEEIAAVEQTDADSDKKRGY
ncbi:MAG: rod shape-determining protein MreC [Muribaculaceae bacterium]|nr:rod shape-determining protein MreC [Muribaculaceae bacterium]MDE5595913.1 rod shape-determining protein MreC [Muribaculaceae bacterium]MDE6702662.1 rod shape-determining protein MreC [Muribaculaceae bacterium]